MPSEFDLIRRHFTRPARHTELAVGDDAALLAPRPGMRLAVSTDMLAGDLVLVAAERFHRARLEARDREALGVEPGLAGDLVVAFLAAGVDAGELDLDAGRGGLWRGGIEAQRAGELAEGALHRHPHLLVVEGDAALVGLDLAVFHRVGGGRGEGEGGEQGEGDAFHGAGSCVRWRRPVQPRRRGSMRVSTSSRSMK